MSKGSPPVVEEPPAADAEEGRPETKVSAIVDQVVTLVIAIAIALAIRQVLVEPFRIPSGSMFPTLLIGDHLFVNKLAYGARIPFSEWRLPAYRKPERGDVIVFEVARPPNQFGGHDIRPVDRAPEDAPREDFVKRLVGMPGDRIAWRSGRVYINDVLLAVTPSGQEFVDESGHSFDMRWEDLGECRHAILADPRPRPIHETRLDRGTWIVEPGRYFMMGDNRDNSNDSRGWGTVRLEEMKGPAFILYWSWNVNGNMLSFFNPQNWISAEKRWDRIFQRVRCEPASSP